MIIFPSIDKTMHFVETFKEWKLTKGWNIWTNINCFLKKVGRENNYVA